MDKPISLSVKDYIIRKMAVKMMLSEKIIEAVVNHQFQSTNEALYHPSHHSVEIGGIGKWLYNVKKAEKKLNRCNGIKDAYEKQLSNAQLSENKQLTLLKKLDTINNDISFLKSKLNKGNEFVADIRGVEEQSASSKGNEECN